MTSQTTAASFELEAMRRALELAAHGPLVGENPRVGCVLLDSSGQVLADGFHRGAGHPHAEVEALTHLESTGLSATGLTAIVSLEPCNHQGKTGPCAQALIRAGVGRVVFGASDPGKASAGGAQALAAAGIEVVGGVLAEESEALNNHWFFSVRHNRPFVTAKWAQSLDGRSAAADGTSQWITGEISRARVHQQRSEHGAIMVGTGTALIDNPTLTARTHDGLYDAQPLAVVVGSRELPRDAKVRRHPGGFAQIDSQKPDEVLGVLNEKAIRSVYLEGGSTLLSAFVAAGLVDSFQIAMGPLVLGGDHPALGDIGVTHMGEALRLSVDSVEKLGDDIWISARPTRAQEGR